MPTLTYDETLTFVTITCGECGITFGVPKHWQEEKRRTGDGFTCPNGHGRVYRKTDVDRLKEELEATKTSLNFWRNEQERERQAHSATKGQLTRAKKRASAGVCPCCHRSFEALARHMETKHPGFAEEERAAPEAPRSDHRCLCGFMSKSRRGLEIHRSHMGRGPDHEDHSSTNRQETT